MSSVGDVQRLRERRVGVAVVAAGERAPAGRQKLDERRHRHHCSPSHAQAAPSCCCNAPVHLHLTTHLRYANAILGYFSVAVTTGYNDNTRVSLSGGN